MRLSKFTVGTALSKYNDTNFLTREIVLDNNSMIVRTQSPVPTDLNVPLSHFQDFDNADEYKKMNVAAACEHVYPS